MDECNQFVEKFASSAAYYIGGEPQSWIAALSSSWRQGQALRVWTEALRRAARRLSCISKGKCRQSLAGQPGRIWVFRGFQIVSQEESGFLW